MEEGPVRGPFIGYRAWRIFDWQEAVLGAAFLDYRWAGPRLSVPVAELPALPTGGGFHAFTAMLLAAEYARQWLTPRHPSSTYFTHTLGFPNSFEPQGGSLGSREPVTWVLGVVQGFGTVAEYDNGWRASDVMVSTLHISPSWDVPFRLRLADRYQCDVTTDADVLLAPPPVPEPITQKDALKQLLAQAPPDLVAAALDMAPERKKSWLQALKGK
jgi:hypothetical protein